MSRPRDKFTIAFDRSPLALTITSLADGRLVDVNDGFVRLSGYARDEAVGRTPEDLGLWIDPEQRRARFARLRAGEPVPDIEARFRLRDGRTLIGIIGSAVVEVDGQPCVLSSVLDVTERRRAEQAALEHERRYRAIVESQVEMVCRFRPDGTILFVNGAYARARGCTPEALTGVDFWSFVDPADREDVHALLMRLSPQAPEISIENRFETVDGPRWTLWTNRALQFDAQGHATEVQSSGIDITDRRVAEQALRASEARYRHIFETAGVSIWDEDFSAVVTAIDALRAQGVTDFARYFDEHPDWVDRAIGLVTIRDVNAASLRLFGATDKAALVESLHGVFVPESRAVFVGELLAIAHGETSFEAEAVVQTLQGERRHVLFTIAFPPPGERFDSVLVTLTDLTLRVHAEAALRESEARFRAFADAAPAILWVTEANGACSFLSRGWYDLTGQTEAEALGSGWLDALHPEDQQATFEAFLRANRTATMFELECRLRCADGVYRWVLATGRPRVGADGGFLGFVGSVIDIDARKRSEDALQHASRMKDEFLATLSHELRTPLNAVVGWAHMLRAGAVPPDVMQHAVEAIERNARAQAQLVDELLDMSRIVSGRLQIRLEPIDVGPVVTAAVDTVRPAAAGKRIDLTVEAPPAPTLVMGDADRLRQVAWNLLTNALKFTPAGGRITTVVRIAEGEAVLSVSDTGEGIAAEFLPFVFDRFRQADASPARRHGGLGLGLSIVRHLVEAHGGTVTAASDGPQRGATFTVRLPLLTAVASLTPAAPRETAARLRGLRVLVVDDDPDARELLRTMLQLSGAEVDVAPSTADALRRLEARPLDLVLTDLGMPDQDGYALLRAIRRMPGDAGVLPVVAVSAYTAPRERERAQLAGFQAHVGKPIDLEDLVRVVLDVMRVRS